jgi:diguanylate cyclase (GGDEF)-like protein
VKRPFCVVMLDLNQFKQVNDIHGHGAGDSLLTQFAGELRTNIRASDIAGRWGGDEFILLLDCDLKTHEPRSSELRSGRSASTHSREERDASH